MSLMGEIKKESARFLELAEKINERLEAWEVEIYAAGPVGSVEVGEYTWHRYDKKGTINNRRWGLHHNDIPISKCNLETRIRALEHLPELERAILDSIRARLRDLEEKLNEGGQP